VDQSSYYQNFDHDSFGNVVRVTDSLTNTLQSAGYNIRGMRESFADMDAGTLTSVPNALGEVVEEPRHHRSAGYPGPTRINTVGGFLRRGNTIWQSDATIQFFRSLYPTDGTPSVDPAEFRPVECANAVIVGFAERGFRKITAQ
jgi:hypothetical protein